MIEDKEKEIKQKKIED